MSRCFQPKWVESRNVNDREDFPLRYQQVFGSNELFFRFSLQANVAKSFLDENRDHLLAEARSELMKQEYKAESLNTCIRELQQQTHAQRLELEDAHLGYAESRREQVRLQEESVMKEKALRDTQIGSIHEMGELKRDQELRFVEFSVQKLFESVDTIQMLTSLILELQERANCMNDSREFKDILSNYSGKISHVPSQRAVIPSPRSMLSRDKRLPLDTWNLSESQGNVLWQSSSYVRFNTDTLSRNSSLHDSRCHRFDSSAVKYRATCRER